MQPPFSINAKIIQLIADISQKMGEVNGLSRPKKTLHI